MQLNLDKYTYLISLAYNTATKAHYTHAWTHTRALAQRAVRALIMTLLLLCNKHKQTNKQQQQLQLQQQDQQQ